MQNKSKQPNINSPFREMEGILHLTEDGSHTLYVPEIDECYHSTHGSVQESAHIFIRDGFLQCAKNEISILEIGFGTGLNAFLTLLASEQENKAVSYTGIELYPIDTDKALLLNYPEILDKSKRRDFEKLHQAEWNKPVKITENFTLTKLKADFATIEFNENFDVIYFDAFSPEKQPEMWGEELFKKLYLCTAENGIITTYCAKGAVRRSLQAAGFCVERLPGPPGKREILRGRK